MNARARANHAFGHLVTCEERSCAATLPSPHFDYFFLCRYSYVIVDDLNYVNLNYS